MPNPTEVAEVRINGQVFKDWKTIEVTRSFTDWASHCLLSTVEPSDAGADWASLKLKPGDAGQVYLAGIKVLDGYVVVRQGAYNAQQHGLQIEIVSKPVDAVKSSVEPKPGQYKNYTYEQIANGVLSPFGINFSFDGGAPAGADKPFPKVNLNPGQEVFSFLETLARMRNIFIRDNEDGNLVGYRATDDDTPIAELQEGRNIKYANWILTDANVFSDIHAFGHRPGGDNAFGDDARDVSASTKDPNATRHSYTGSAMPHPGDSDDAWMNVDHEGAYLSATSVVITTGVQGWFMDGGELWITKIGKPVSLVSPMIFSKLPTLRMRSCTHKQDDAGGTSTEMVLCLRSGLGGPLIDDIQGGAPDAFNSGPAPAQPDASDSI